MCRNSIAVVSVSVDETRVSRGLFHLRIDFGCIFLVNAIKNHTLIIGVELVSEESAEGCP